MGRRRQWAWAPRAGCCPPTQTRRVGLPGTRQVKPGPTGPHPGPISPATSASPGPRGEGSLCSLWAKQGGNHRHLPPPPLLAESCQLSAAAVQSRSAKVRCREAAARSAPPRAGREVPPGPAPPRAPRPAPPRAPRLQAPPSPRASQPHSPGPRPQAPPPAAGKRRLTAPRPRASVRPTH